MILSGNAKRIRAREGALVSLAVALLALIGFGSAHAQERPTPTLDQINAVARELYCPLCNGVRLDTCELLACEQMRQVIAGKLVQGVPKEQIKADFVAQYGPVVLGEPPRAGLNWLGWILPIAALLAGAGWLIYTARRWTRPPAAVPTSPFASTTSVADSQTDDYLNRVESDLEKLE